MLPLACTDIRFFSTTSPNRAARVLVKGETGLLGAKPPNAGQTRSPSWPAMRMSPPSVNNDSGMCTLKLTLTHGRSQTSSTEPIEPRCTCSKQRPTPLESLIPKGTPRLLLLAIPLHAPMAKLDVSKAEMDFSFCFCTARTWFDQVWLSWIGPLRLEWRIDVRPKCV